MQDKRFLFFSFRLFFKYKPLRLITLFIITLFLGFGQGFSIMLLIPMLRLLSPEQSAHNTSKWATYTNDMLSHLGMQTSLPLILTVFAVCLAVIAVLTYYQLTVSAAYQQGFSYHTRKRLYKKIITSSWNFLNKKSKHNHIQILTSEIPKMTVYYNFYLGMVSKLIIISAHIVLALMLSVQFTLFIVFMGLIIFFSLRKYLMRSSLLGGWNIQAFRNMLKYVDDFWSMIKIAKVHNTEAFYYKKFNESNAQMFDLQYRQIKNRAIPQFWFTLAGIITLVLVIYLAYSLVLLPLASLFVLILLFARIFPQLNGMNNDMNMLVSNIESVKMVLAMDSEIEEKDFATLKTTEEIAFTNQIEIRNLNFSYEPEHPLFTNFSESIPACKITGIIGQSGCGKTTLIDIIAGLQKTNDGVIMIDGKPLTEDKLPFWKSKLGYLPQDSFFVDGTFRENLIWDSGENLTDEEILEILKQVNAGHLVLKQKTGLDTPIVNYQYHFSGGERQRLALARVLIRKPKLLLLDEATSSLDPENEAQIMDCLLRLKNNVTIVFVTHRQNLKPYFDKIIDLNHGTAQ